MLPAITASNFTGALALRQSSFSTSIQEYIDRYYLEYVVLAIGASNASEVSGASPLTSRWQNVFDGGFYTDKDGGGHYFGGLFLGAKEYIYANYARDYFTFGVNGLSNSQSENAQKASAIDVASVSIDAFNRSTTQANKALCYMQAFVEREVAIASIAGSVVTADTTNLLDGDTVSIGGIDYVVSNVTSSTFEVVGTPVGTAYTFSAFNVEGIEDKHYLIR